MPLPGDNPIEDHTKDVLERSDRADAFARQVLELDASHGTAVGVFAPWGSGKTSFVNLARKTFERDGALVLDFNPWLFSGAEQLVERFFAELSASMGIKDELKEIGEAFGKYGAALNAVAGVASAVLAVPHIGALVEKVTKTAVNMSQPESIAALRKRIEDALKERDERIVVVLDDVDRLSPTEIREVFKLVRLTASFPNLIYIVSCDRLRVEQALDEKGLSGRDYLEKIIQWSFNLPEVPSHLLAQQLFEAIENALADIENPGSFDKEVWGDVYAGILRPLIRNIRDVRRFAIAIRETVRGLDGTGCTRRCSGARSHSRVPARRLSASAQRDRWSYRYVPTFRKRTQRDDAAGFCRPVPGVPQATQGECRRADRGGRSKPGMRGGPDSA